MDTRVTPCCNYAYDTADYPVMWNPYNKVVQCHNCGHVYVPQPMDRPEPSASTRVEYTFHLEHKLISESPRVLSYRFSDAPETVYASVEQALAARNLPDLEVDPTSK